jgi:signal transduction histidine kinase
MTEPLIAEQLNALGRHLRAERDSILKNWRLVAEWDPLQSTARALTRAQFNDHIPPLLDAFEIKLGAPQGSGREAKADDASRTEELKHGLQRWQQGYKLGELMQEWGYLQRCISNEIGSFARTQPEFRIEALHTAHSALIDMISEGIKRSVGEYSRLQQAEAAGHVRDLKQALGDISEIERHRSVLIHQAVHDLRGNVQSVRTAADVLGESDMGENDRVAMAKQIQKEVEVVGGMLGELMMLARLEAGQEKRRVVPCDAAKVLAELSNSNMPVAAARSLYLKTEGPVSLPVESDPGKLRRLVQNLLLNAIKYTNRGGVTVSWGEEKESWWVSVKDTGPGMLAGPSAPITGALKEATAIARETEIAGSDSPQVLPLAAGDPKTSPQAQNRSSGEGIGLSIVKRLCELLDASVEFASSSEAGSTFRVRFPRSYLTP